MAINPELVDKIKQAYLDQQFTLDELSQQSRQLFGVYLDPIQMHGLAVQGRWMTLKRRKVLGKTGLPHSPEEAMAHLAQMVYDAAMDTEDPVSNRDLASLISAYMNLTARLPAGDASEKTDRQQVLDMLAELNADKPKPKTD